MNFYSKGAFLYPATNHSTSQGDSENISPPSQNLCHPSYFCVLDPGWHSFGFCLRSDSLSHPLGQGICQTWKGEEIQVCSATVCCGRKVSKMLPLVMMNSLGRMFYCNEMCVHANHLVCHTGCPDSLHSWTGRWYIPKLYVFMTLYINHKWLCKVS